MPEFSFADRLSNAWVRRRPRRLHDVRPDRPIVSFTFDDVPRSAFENAVPVLEEEGVRGTFFAAGGLAGRRHDGIEMMAAEGYGVLAARGHEIGHHSFSHRRPVALGLRFGEDVRANDAFLAANVPGAIRNYAFPYGLSAPWARHVLAPKFRSLRSAQGGINVGEVDLDYLRGVDICTRATPAELSKWIADAAAMRGWLIFLTHDVRDGHGPYGCTPALLRALVREARDAGCEVLTVDAALDRVGAPA